MPHEIVKKYKNQVEENESSRIARNAGTRVRGGAVIAEVAEESVAHELGIVPGEVLIEINDAPARDAIQLRLADASENLSITVASADGEVSRYEIEKESFESLGLHIDSELYDGVTRCTNKCPFCFVDALPKRLKKHELPMGQSNLRRTLYVRDDDFRLSFMHGHYITLTNLSDDDYARIIDERLTPLCVSVHATDPETRIKMVGNKTGGDIIERLKYLIDNGITVNTQIVLCPGFNDGEILDRSIEDLQKLRPGVESMAVVPVGFTKYLPASRGLRALTEADARRILKQIAPHQKRSLEATGSHFIHASDEMYLLANKPIPSVKFYDGYPQFANGVGTIRAFKEEVNLLRRRQSLQRETLPQISFVTGKLAAPFLRELAQVLEAKRYAKVRVHDIESTFWGGNVACAGLVMGQEILEQVKNGDCGQQLFFPPDAVNAQRQTLDDISIDDIAARLSTRARIDASGPLEIAAALK